MDEFTFGKRLANLRKNRNLTQSDLAARLGVSQSALAMWETEKRDPDSEMILKLAAFFGVTSDYLLGLSHDPSELLNREIEICLLELEEGDGHFSDEVAMDIFLIFQGQFEEANAENFDESFEEFLEFHGGIPKPGKGESKDRTIFLLHHFYNIRSIRNLIRNSHDIEWKESIKNKLLDVVAKNGLSILKNPFLIDREFVYEVELTNSNLKHKILVDNKELTPVEIDKIVELVRLDRRFKS